MNATTGRDGEQQMQHRLGVWATAEWQGDASCLERTLPDDVVGSGSRDFLLPTTEWLPRCTAGELVQSGERGLRPGRRGRAHGRRCRGEGAPILTELLQKLRFLQTMSRHAYLGAATGMLAPGWPVPQPGSPGLRDGKLQ